MIIRKNIEKNVMSTLLTFFYVTIFAYSKNEYNFIVTKYSFQYLLLKNERKSYLIFLYLSINRNLSKMIKVTK